VQAVVLPWCAMRLSTWKEDLVCALPVLVVGLPRRAALQATPIVTSISTLLVLVVVMLWRAAQPAWIQISQVFVVLLQWHTRVQTTLSTKLAHALPTLVVMLWHARLQSTSNVNSVHTLPALMVLLTWCATLQATLSVSSVHALPVTVLALLWHPTLQARSSVTSFHALPAPLGVLRLW
jgi:hypothetical protein